MSYYTYNRYPREQFIAYAKRQGYAIAKDLEVKDSQGRRLNNKDKIERYEEMVRFIRTGVISLHELRDLKILIELQKEIGIVHNPYTPGKLLDEFKELYESMSGKIIRYFNEWRRYFIPEIEKFNKEEQTRKESYEIIEPKQRIPANSPEWKEHEAKQVARYLAQVEAEEQEQDEYDVWLRTGLEVRLADEEDDEDEEDEEEQHRQQMKAFGYSTCCICEAELEDSQIGYDGVCIECAHNEDEEEEEELEAEEEDWKKAWEAEHLKLVAEAEASGAYEVEIEYLKRYGLPTGAQRAAAELEEYKREIALEAEEAPPMICALKLLQEAYSDDSDDDTEEITDDSDSEYNNILYDEGFLKTCDEKTIVYLYQNQYDEYKNIPPIDKDWEDGYDVYKIYIYGNYTKYYCKMFRENDIKI